jgi:hypothetical protein
MNLLVIAAEAHAGGKRRYRIPPRAPSPVAFRLMKAPERDTLSPRERAVNHYYFLRYYNSRYIMTVISARRTR